MDGRSVNLRATMETQGFRWKRHCGEKHTANSVYSYGPEIAHAQSTQHAHNAARGGAHTYGRTYTLLLPSIRGTANGQGGNREMRGLST